MHAEYTPASLESSLEGPKACCLSKNTCVHAKSLQLCPTCATLWTAARQAPLSMDSSGKNIGGGCHVLIQGIFLTQGSNLCLLCLPALAGVFFTTSTTWEAPQKTHPFPAGPPQYTNFPHRRFAFKFKVFVSRRPLLKKAAFKKLECHHIQGQGLWSQMNQVHVLALPFRSQVAFE